MSPFYMLSRCLLGSLLAAASLSASAASISLSPLTQTVGQGNQVSLQLTMDFTGDPTLGGGIDISYNSSLLSFASFTFDPGLGDDPLLER